MAAPTPDPDQDPRPTDELAAASKVATAEPGTPPTEPEPEPDEPDELDALAGPGELDEDEGPPSRSRLRDEARAYLELAEALTKGKYRNLPNPPFDEHLRAEISDAQRFLKNARSRQIRRLAQLLRETSSLAELHQALEGRTPEARAAQALERACESWRARLLDEGDAALSALCEAHPQADRQRLRQLVRQAGRTPPDVRSKRAATSLLREVRVLLLAAASA